MDGVENNERMDVWWFCVGMLESGKENRKEREGKKRIRRGAKSR